MGGHNKGMLTLSEDVELYQAVQKEIVRQESHLDLIASENIASPAVCEAVGSVLTNKYAEGYPACRYYGGCEYVDQIEDLARDRAKKLFFAKYANVQPHSGSQANMAILSQFLEPGDTIMGMHLSAGGHLTHGAKVSFSGRIFNAVSYGVHPETFLIDYDEIRTLAYEKKPKLIIAGISSYPRSICFESFEKIANEVGAYLLADIAHLAGLVATGLHPSPVPHADFVTTTTHKTLRGPRGGLILMGSKRSQTLTEKTYGPKNVRKTYSEAVDSAVFPLIQGGPLMHVIAGKAACFYEALQPSFRTYQEQVVKNAKKLGQVLIEGGLQLVTGGTDNHLCLVDLRSLKGLTGKDAEAILGKVGIVVNKNVIPFDTVSPFYASGIRIGTPTLTTRGMKEAEMICVGEYIIDALKNAHNEDILKDIRKKTLRLTEEFPLGFL